jgi:hypothetical protein
VPVNRILPPEAIAGGGDPRSMVPVRLAGAEVTVTWVPLMFSAARHGENEFC